MKESENLVVTFNLNILEGKKNGIDYNIVHLCLNPMVCLKVIKV